MSNNKGEIKMRTSELVLIVQSQPEVIEVYVVDNVINIITTENPDDDSDHTFPLFLNSLNMKWISNDCEGCFNEYAIVA